MQEKEKELREARDSAKEGTEKIEMLEERLGELDKNVSLLKMYSFFSLKKHLFRRNLIEYLAPISYSKNLKNFFSNQTPFYVEALSGFMWDVMYQVKSFFLYAIKHRSFGLIEFTRNDDSIDAVAREQ